MERDSFIFYKSFYEAISGLTKDIRLEVLTAIIEYALYGRTPDNLKPFAKGMFTLIKPNIDVNTARYENGKKGGRRSRTASASANDLLKGKSAPVEAPYSLAYEQEVESMKTDKQWSETICRDFNITVGEYYKRLSRFLDHCKDEKTRKGKDRHDSFEDCQSHFRYWMTKAYPLQQIPSAASEEVRRQQQRRDREKSERQQAAQQRDSQAWNPPEGWVEARMQSLMAEKKADEAAREKAVIDEARRRFGPQDQNSSIRPAEPK